MFQHYHVILRELIISTLPSYTNVSNAAIGNTICVKICKLTVTVHLLIMVQNKKNIYPVCHIPF
jgi:hypothetical protein